MKTIFCFLFSVFFAAGTVYSQCSDAGVCTIGEKHDRNILKKNSVAVFLQYSYGNSGGDQSNSFNNLKLGGEISITGNFSFSLFVPVLFMNTSNQVYDPNGLTVIPSGTSSGIADAFLYLNYRKKSGKNISYSFQAGLKAASSAFNKDNFKYYNAQGTNDLLLGADLDYSFLNFSIGTQVPLSKYEDDDRSFGRGADIFFRAGYFNEVKKATLKFEFIGIKRMNKTKFTAKQYGGIYAVGTETEIDNSDFFQLNILGGMGYKVAEDITGDFNVAVPLLKRDENSDGTKRAFTVSAGFKFMFSM